MDTLAQKRIYLSQRLNNFIFAANLMQEAVEVMAEQQLKINQLTQEVESLRPPIEEQPSPQTVE